MPIVPFLRTITVRRSLGAGPHLSSSSLSTLALQLLFLSSFFLLKGSSCAAVTFAMSDVLYEISELDNSVILSYPLDDGTLFPLIITYSEAQSKAVIVRGRLFYSYFRSHPRTGTCRCILCFLGGYCRAAVCDRCTSQLDVCTPPNPDVFFLEISAFNTRAYKNSKMFVRTHVVFYFVSLLLSDILQGAFRSVVISTHAP